MIPKQTILERIENQARQQLFGGILLAVAGLMIMTTLGWVRADTDQTNLTFNVTAGNFSLVNAPESMAFASQEYLTSNNITGNEQIDGPTVTDYRGNTQEWDVTVNASNFTGDEILASALNLYADEGDITNIAGDFNYVAVGGNGTLDGGIILFNGSNLAEGVFQYDNGFINLTVDGTDPAGEYTATLIYTLA